MTVGSIISFGEEEGKYDGEGCADRLACSKASANALTEAKRLEGSFSSAVITTCSTAGKIDGIFSRSGGGGAKACLAITSVKEP